MCGGEWDGEPNAVETYSWKKSRIEHTCCACKETIRRGDQYHVMVVIPERGAKPDTWKHCARCWFICRALWDAGAESIDLTLNCGERWADNFTPDSEPGALAFMTKDEAQEQARRIGSPATAEPAGGWIV